MKQQCTFSKLPPIKCAESEPIHKHYSKSLDLSKKSFISSSKNTFINKKPPKNHNISTSRVIYHHQSSSSLVSQWDYSFHPEINQNSCRISGGKLRGNIHERLYQQSKSMKRSKSYKISPTAYKLPNIALDYDRIYKNSLIYKAESRGKNLLLRRNLSIYESKELKFSPDVCKFDFAEPRKPKKIGNLLILNELYKKASRYKLVRKYQYK